MAAGLGQASPAARSPAGIGGVCGLPDERPLWLEYAEGSVSFRNDVFGRPGVIAATSGTVNSSELRARGAQTVYWWMKLNRVAGTPSAPTDAATVAAGITEIVDKAVAATECETPVIVLNELNGAASTTPWTPTNGRYRANVLTVLQGIAARGGHPLLLLSARPYTGGDALAWWQQVGQVAHIVREVYFPAPPLMRTGAVLASRTMRQKFRQGLAPLLKAGIPPDRLGLVIGFQSGPGKGGREGLQPTAAWLRFAKLLTLAAKQVASELKIGSVVSWGWGTFDTAGADADKAKAACVYLWARDPKLCDGPLAAGAGFNASLRGRTDRSAAGHALQARRPDDLEARGEGAVGAHGRHPGGAERALRAARRVAWASGRDRRRARARADDHRRPVRWLALGIPVGSALPRSVASGGPRDHRRPAPPAGHREDARDVRAPTSSRDLALPHAVRCCFPCDRCVPTALRRGSAAGGEGSRSSLPDRSSC